jgi:Amiloride-sensitive sodium channel
MELQQFLPTSEFACDENETSFDICVLKNGVSSAPCLLPFLSFGNTSNLPLCQTPADGEEAFQIFQSASHSCLQPCKQLTTELEYSQPQYLRSLFLSKINQHVPKVAYQLILPSTIKVSKSIPNYGFISFIAEVAGWFTLFLGGSFLSFWEIIWMLFCIVLTKVNVKCKLLTLIQQKVCVILTCGILFYILIDCVVTWTNSPVETSTTLTPNINGVGLSICLPQYTSISQTDAVNSQTYKDVANTSEFWIRGASLSSKIVKMSVKKIDGDRVTIWNNDLNASPNQSAPSLFKNIIILGDLSVNFCHFFDISTLPFLINEVMINVVNDVTLVFHLAGQLLRSQSYYDVANQDTVTMQSSTIFFYGSELGIQLQETSFQELNSEHCENYNSSWTFDNCLLDSALSKLFEQQVHRPTLKGNSSNEQF